MFFYSYSYINQLLLPLFFYVTDVSSGEEDAPEPVEQDEETRELRIIDPNAYVSLLVRKFDCNVKMFG